MKKAFYLFCGLLSLTGFQSCNNDNIESVAPMNDIVGGTSFQIPDRINGYKILVVEKKLMNIADNLFTNKQLLYLVLYSNYLFINVPII